LLPGCSNASRPGSLLMSTPAWQYQEAYYTISMETYSILCMCVCLCVYFMYTPIFACATRQLAPRQLHKKKEAE
jgi:hypothetical protein